MGPSKYLDCELYLSAADQARLSAEGREYTGRPVLDEDLERRLLETAGATEYGTLLFEALLPATDGELLAGYREALVIAEESARRLRLRFHVATTAAPWLHRLHWELLYDPKRRLALGRSREIAFSRYLSVPATRPSAVVRPKLLATLSRIRDRMLAGNFHALHLQAHGLRRHDQTVAHLVLEDENRDAAFVDEELFAEVFEGQRELRLVTLIACHGGRPTAVDPFSGLGPALVRQGIAAVIAMQRAISVTAAGRFSEHFYRNLARDGRVDAATNEARLQLHLADPQGTEWGTPALYMRLADSRLWPPEAGSDSTAWRIDTAELEIAGPAASSPVPEDSIDTRELTHSGTDGFPVPAAVLERRAARRRRLVRGAGALVLVLLAALAVAFGAGWLAPRLDLEGTPKITVLGLRELPSTKPEPWIVTAVAELLVHDLEVSELEWLPAPGWTADLAESGPDHSSIPRRY